MGFESGIKEQTFAPSFDTSATATADVLSLSGKATTRGTCGAKSGGHRRLWVDLPVGFAVLVLTMLAGEQIKVWLHLPVPGRA
jgi:hypothetical protein